jgi:hypothetical protein
MESQDLVIVVEVAGGRRAGYVFASGFKWFRPSQGAAASGCLHQPCCLPLKDNAWRGRQRTITPPDQRSLDQMKGSYGNRFVFDVIDYQAAGTNDIQQTTNVLGAHATIASAADLECSVGSVECP